MNMNSSDGANSGGNSEVPKTSNAGAGAAQGSGTSNTTQQVPSTASCRCCGGSTLNCSCYREPGEMCTDADSADAKRVIQGKPCCGCSGESLYLCEGCSCVYCHGCYNDHPECVRHLFPEATEEKRIKQEEIKRISSIDNVLNPDTSANDTDKKN